MLLRQLASGLQQVPYFRGRDRLIDFVASRLPEDVEAVIDGVRLELCTREVVGLSLVLQGNIEPLTSAALRRLLRPGDVFVDVGAHVGLLSMIAARSVGSGGRVLAIDPQPVNCDRVLRNAALNGFRQVHVIVAAAGSSSGHVQLRFQRESDRSRLSIVLPEPNALPYEFEVPLLTIDSILRRHGIEHVRTLKIDTEGYELEVLRGCNLAAVESVILEVLPDAQDTDAVASLLREHGFELQDVRGQPVTDIRALPECNLLAVRTTPRGNS